MTDRNPRSERRHIVVALFPPILVAVAFTEAVPSVRDEALMGQYRFVLWGLLVIFVTTAVRFLIGNQFHLAQDGLLNHEIGGLWFSDLIFVIVESIILIALGGQVADAALLGPNNTHHIPQNTFVPILIALYTVDIVWILSQWLVGRIVPRCRRSEWPWMWALLNGCLLAIVLLGNRPISGRTYSHQAVLELMLFHVVAFVVDLWLIDFAGLRRTLKSDNDVTIEVV